MPVTSNPGRVAGFTYFLLVLCGPFNLIYVPSHLFVPGNATATAANIAQHEMLFRAWIASGLAESVLFVFVSLALYRLLVDVHRPLAQLMVIFVVMSALIGFVADANALASLQLLRAPDYLNVFDKPQREALAYFFLRFRGQIITGDEMFWGLWLFPLVGLVYRSRFLPRFLGVWLALAGCGWVAESLTGLLAPQYSDLVSKITFPATIGEVALVLWLLIKGAAPVSKRISATS